MTNLGKIADGNEGERDAVHVATEVRIAKRKLQPGEVVDNYGIVDPFLTQAVCEGQKYLYCLRPGLVNDMRHEWSFDKLPKPQPKTETAVELLARLAAVITEPKPVAENKAASKQWLREFCDSYMHGFTFETFIDALRQANRTGFGYTIEGSTEPDETRTQQEQIWLHYSIFTGEKVDPNNTTFTCSC